MRTVGFIGLVCVFLLLSACDADNAKKDAPPAAPGTPGVAGLDLERDLKNYCDSKSADIQAAVTRLYGIAGTTDCAEAAKRLRRMETLDLSTRAPLVPLKDLSLLGLFGHLKGLDVSGNKVSDQKAYNFLPAMTGLRNLSMASNDRVEIPSLPPDLETLDVANNLLPDAKSYRAIARTKLKSAIIVGNPNLAGYQAALATELAKTNPGISLYGLNGDLVPGTGGNVAGPAGADASFAARFANDWCERLKRKELGVEVAKTVTAIISTVGRVDAPCGTVSEALGRLRTLRLDGVILTDFEPLEIFSHVTTLHLTNLDLANVPARLPSGIVVLYLSGNRRMTDANAYTRLRDLPQLTTVVIRGNPDPGVAFEDDLRRRDVTLVK